METTLFSLSIYALGVFGLFATGLLPVRAWHVVKAANKKRRALVSAYALVAALVPVHASTTYKTFTCLTQSYRGPGVASGWINLAALGVAYVLLELAGWGLSLVAKTNVECPARARVDVD